MSRVKREVINGRDDDAAFIAELRKEVDRLKQELGRLHMEAQLLNQNLNIKQSRAEEAERIRAVTERALYLKTKHDAERSAERLGRLDLANEKMYEAVVGVWLKAAEMELNKDG